MSAPASDVAGPEQAFIDAVDGLAWSGPDGSETARLLDDWLRRLCAELAAPPLRRPDLRPEHPLAVQAAAFEVQLARDLPAWLRQRDELADMQSVARNWDDKAVLLVFGKFNAGKSSLCNFVAERFAANGRPVRYFRLEAGRLLPAEGRFGEGATETTTALQGVCLGRGLVLLDTPGLHSATPENAELTRRFTDSADGVLWLTSSRSPGQVQELEELARELRRAKPLLPVVTCSDFLDEDEIDGEIVKRLCNKSAADRAMQEADVQARGREKLSCMGVAPALLMPPVSLSVSAARGQDQTPDALARAGFDAFWAAFAALVTPALGYKRRKYAEMALHHREEQVLQGLRDRQRPALDALLRALDAEESALEERRAALVRTAWRAVAPLLPDLLDGPSGQRDPASLCRQLSVALRDAMSSACDAVLAGWRLCPEGFAWEIAVPADTASACKTDEDLHAALQDALRTALLQAADESARQCVAAIEGLRHDAQALQDTLRRYADELAGLERALRPDATRDAVDQPLK